MTLVPYLALTFAISLAGFACIFFIPAARSPESATGLPFWIVMVWGPSLAAIILSVRSGEAAALLGRTVKLATVPPDVWALVLAPLLLLFLIRPLAADEAEPLGVGLIVLMVGFNLVLGPLGEELGWRGVMQEHLNQHLGWLEASLVVGLVWLAWHLPLWAIDSPHSKISLPLFAAHCMFYSVIIGGAYTLSGGSILPAILLHLTVNLASNLAAFVGFRDPNAWFGASLVPYGVLAVGTVLLVHARTGQIGLGWLSSLR